MERDAGIRGWLRGSGSALAFYLYAFLAAPPLARALKAGLAEAGAIWWPGLLLLLVMLAEPFGLRWKLQFLRRRNRAEAFEPQGSMLGIFSAAAIGHMIVTLMVGMLMLDCWGVVGTGSDAGSTWWGAVIVALILKEFAAFFACVGQSVSREAPGHWQEHLADFFLLAFGCVAYTAWWGALLDLGDIAGESLGMKLVLVPLLGGVFLLFYLPLRLPFLLEEAYLQPAQGRKKRILVELAIGLVFGLYPAFA